MKRAAAGGVRLLESGTESRAKERKGLEVERCVEGERFSEQEGQSRHESRWRSKSKGGGEGMI